MRLVIYVAKKYETEYGSENLNEQEQFWTGLCFAKLLDYHWELSKKIDAGSSNTLIEQIFSCIEELVDGKLVCGAGGGGFLQVILKKGVTRQMVEERLKEVFMDSLVGVADCNLVWE